MTQEAHHLSSFQAQHSPMVDLTVSCPDWLDDIPYLETLTQEVLSTVLNQVLKKWAWENEVEVSVVFTNNQDIQALNHEFRGKNKPTNVLSFPNVDKETFKATENPLKTPLPFILGDIILAYETVMKEALDQGKNKDHHIIHLLVHGALHLVGMDHMDDQEAEAMEALEINILNQLGVSNPYI